MALWTVFDVVVETEFLRQLVERHATDNTRAHLSEKSLGLGGIGMEEIVAHDKFKYRVAEVLKSLVAQVVVADTFL